jgi:PQQ-dependent dehydrogenase (methanol/ethanol family)
MEKPMPYRTLISICTFFAVATALAAGKVTNERVLAESASGENWFLKGGNFRGEHFSPLSQVNDKNVNNLGLAWSADLPIPDGISATPIVVDGVIYFSGAYSVVFAVDAGSGEVLWSYDPEVRNAFAKHPQLSWISRVNRGVAVWDGDVFATTADCRLIAIDAASGKAKWTKQVCDSDGSFSISDSPYVGGDKVFVGNAGSESPNGDRGYVSAYDHKTGALLWKFYIVPSANDEENDTPAMKMAAKTWSGDTLAKHGGGGHSWNEMTYDPVSNLLFFGTSGSYPYVYKDRSPEGGDNLFLSSVVAVNADTGEYVWHYQTVDKDSWDFNATMNIILADLNIGGEDRETVLIAPKNGFHYALDRYTGELLTTGKFAKANWATHINMETGRPVYDPAGEYWNLKGGETAVVWPNMWGSHSWNPMAFHPDLGLSYIPVVDAPSVLQGRGDGSFSDDTVVFTEVDGQKFSPGKLVAFDPVSQSIRWTVDHPLPYNGGVMATAGNLVFQGNAEGKFVAYAADSGKELWSVTTGSAINAAPASYLLDGKQYIVIPVGAGGGVQFYYPKMHATEDSKGPTRLMAFTLEGKTEMPDADDTHPPLPEQPELDAAPGAIIQGKALYAENCKGCHGIDAAARFGGSVPDLRYADQATHASWNGIVVGGARISLGMPSFPLKIEESEAIRNYVLSLSAEIRAQQ